MRSTQRCPTHTYARTPTPTRQSPTSFPPRPCSEPKRDILPPQKREVSVSFLTLVTQSPTGTQKLQNTPLSNQKRPFSRVVPRKTPKVTVQSPCPTTFFSAKKRQIPSFSVPRPPSARCCVLPRHRPNR
ncbi:hypothetical protein BDP81DRAFT_210694 [Colletotrichum phormii]|uniref:Uncharacterized protein n=1 Tax=Colletotrichum phormii TaxID=359342 RepID=A0AAJ0EI24_9PEZI|nr:uncharacterized protein BDP81DRAFT_210694 [Colletotrichum phormii]KAK1637525.1 hypothetical protein BDP81DRAFT_210694 [Colletotrichum phormii]